MMLADINCDMGESFGLYTLGNDAAIMPFISQANIACGFHGSDPNHMAATVALANEYGVRIGAHVSLPDLVGFGRREMKVERDELRNIILYQVGALTGFLKETGSELSHIKPHGALYGMAARQEHIAEAVADAAAIYGLAVMGLSGTLHETVYRERGIEFLGEFFADLEYGDDGSLIITRDHGVVDPALAAGRSFQAVVEGTLVTVGGCLLPVTAGTVCVHSDTPNAADVASAVHRALSGGGERMHDQT